MKLILASILSIVLFASNSRGETSRASAPMPDRTELRATPVVASVDNVPTPVKGSDGRFHLVYELNLFNVTGSTISLTQLTVVNAESGTPIATLDSSQIAQRLSIASSRTSNVAEVGSSQTGILYLHVSFGDESAIPKALRHELALMISGKTVTETVPGTAVNPPTKLVLAPPLEGRHYIAGDGCCDSIRHVRATLPINGQLFDGQRFAIDWEQLDAQGHIYVGDPKVPQSYVVYGQPVYAVADATVIAAVDGMPDSPPGALPANIGINEADGNHVVLDLGHGNYALYAHLAPNSLQVAPGQRVHQGEMLGRVGTSGNSSEPHLHFQVSSGPNPLASNGVPYLIRQFTASERGVSTQTFDQAIADGQPVPMHPLDGSPRRVEVLPLDLSIVDFSR